ncbi:MAG: DNA polymerase III subunit delta [Candidatus Dormibacteraceae bacterium]
MKVSKKGARSTEILLIHGEERFLVEEQAVQIVAQWRKELVSSFGLDSLDPGNLNANRLAEAILQAPFLDPYRVIVVRDIPLRRADGLALALTEVPETTRLLLTVNGKLGVASKLAKAVRAAGGQLVEHVRLKNKALGEWVTERARSLGLPSAVGPLVARLARPELVILDSELRKLAAYQAAAGKLTQTVVRELVVSDRPEDIFRLTDTLLPRPTAESWRVLRQLLWSESPMAVSYRLARHISLVLEVHSRQQRGEDLAACQSAMREHPFVIQKAFQVARRTPQSSLERGLNALLDYEWKVKSGQIDAEFGLQNVLAQI